MTGISTPPATSRATAWGAWFLTLLLLATPILAWLAPRAYAPLVGVAGLLALPAFRVRDSDRPAAIAILVIVVWACGSVAWSPYVARNLGQSTAAKLVVQAMLYGSAIAAARQASDQVRRWLLLALVWGMVGLSLMMLVEAASGAGLYRALRIALGDPIRPDLAIKNVAQALFILALFAPAAVVAAGRVAGSMWLGLPILAGIVWPSILFTYDAPLVALAASALAMGLLWVWPRLGPRLLAILAAGFFLGAPSLVWATRKLGWFDRLQASVSLSWSQRMGYWRHAQDWIADHPARGWGLDASRMFAPGIQLHPHDAALQIWLELGLIGAVGAAVLWAVILAGMGRPRRDGAVAASAGCAVAYLTFNAVSFGIWQEWWLALGALACAVCAALQRQPARGESTLGPILG